METSTASTPSGTSSMNMFQKIIGIYFNPEKVFQNLTKNWEWLVPTVIIIILAIGAGQITKPIWTKMQVEKIQNNANIPDEQKEQIVENMEQSKGFMMNTGWMIFAVVAIFVVYLIMAGAVLFTGNFIFGGEAKFINVLNMVCFASVIGILETLIVTPMMLSQGTMKIHLGLAAFLSEEQSKTFLFRLFDKINVFGLWEVFLMIIGTSVVYKFSKSKAATAILILWGIYVLGYATLGGILRFGN